MAPTGIPAPPPAWLAGRRGAARAGGLRDHGAARLGGPRLDRGRARALGLVDPARRAARARGCPSSSCSRASCSGDRSRRPCCAGRRAAVRAAVRAQPGAAHPSRVLGRPPCHGARPRRARSSRRSRWAGFFGAIHDPWLLGEGRPPAAELLGRARFTSGVTPAWSLAVEVVFYAVLPLLALLAAGALARRRHGSLRRRVMAALAPAGVLLVVGLFGQAARDVRRSRARGGHRGRGTPSSTGSFLTHADLFAFGMAVAVLQVAARGWPDPHLAPAPAGGRSRARCTWTVPFLIVGFAALPHDVFEPLVHAALRAAARARRARTARRPAVRGSCACSSATDRRAGKASYSVFLWNYPVVAFLADHGLTARATPRGTSPPTWRSPCRSSACSPRRPTSASSALRCGCAASRAGRSSSRRSRDRAARPA